MHAWLVPDAPNERLKLSRYHDEDCDDRVPDTLNERLKFAATVTVVAHLEEFQMHLMNG